MYPFAVRLFKERCGTLNNRNNNNDDDDYGNDYMQNKCDGLLIIDYAMAVLLLFLFNSEKCHFALMDINKHDIFIIIKST